MFLIDSKIIDKRIIDAIEHIFFITSAEKIPLNAFVPMLKLEFKQNYPNLQNTNKKNRNIHFYIKKQHKSISNFINTFTEFKIIDNFIFARFIQL
jgi:hypothetical protein